MIIDITLAGFFGMFVYGAHTVIKDITARERAKLIEGRKPIDGPAE